MVEQVVEKIREGRVIAIIRGFEPDVCLHLAEAYAKGGIRAVEVTYRQNAPETWKDTAAAISAIAARFGDVLAVGAGTVLTSEQLKMTADAGGRFMVAPNVKPSLIRECAAGGLAAIPGAMTPSEVVEAWEAGATFVKVFPAGTLGPGYIKALRAPLAHVRLLAVGGVTPDNAAAFMQAGSEGVGVSGALCDKQAIAAGDWASIEAAAKLLVERTRT